MNTTTPRDELTFSEQGPDAKPVVRVKAGTTASEVNWASASVGDSFQNFQASIGIGTQNQHSGSGYGFNFLTKNRTALEAAYRGSWIVGAAVDIPADDMTQAGVDLHGLDPKTTDAMYQGINDLMLCAQMADNIRWGRLFGGSIAYIMIDGASPDAPLKVDTIQKGQFKGLHVMDRWQVNPSIGPGGVVTDLGPDIGLPLAYRTFGTDPGLRPMVIDHTRALRQIGVPLPLYQKRLENLWGESVVERLWDRLVGYDSTTAGVVQLVYKAYLRVMKVKNLRNVIASTPAAQQALGNQFAMMRQFQNSEGVTLVDMEDEFEALTYTFAGLDAVMEKMEGQLCGAMEVPHTRLFGDSPGGLNATGDNELRSYGDKVNKDQEIKTRRMWAVTLDILHRSVTGVAPPEGFGFRFRPLYKPNDKEKADMGKAVGDSVVATYGAGIISQRVALTELRGSAEETGLYGSISDEDIAQAEETAPSADEIIAQREAELNPDPASDPEAESGTPGDQGQKKVAKLAVAS